MALVVAASGGWGTVATTGGAHDAPLPNCLARLIQNKHQVRLFTAISAPRQPVPSAIVLLMLFDKAVG